MVEGEGGVEGGLEGEKASGILTVLRFELVWDMSAQIIRGVRGIVGGISQNTLVPSPSSLA